MTSISAERIAAIEARKEELQRALSAGSVPADEFVRLSKDYAEIEPVAAAAREVRERLGEGGRLLLRYSGTEPLARVMIEGESQAVIERLAGGLAAVIGRSLGVNEAGGEGR